MGILIEDRGAEAKSYSWMNKKVDHTHTQTELQIMKITSVYAGKLEKRMSFLNMFSPDIVGKKLFAGTVPENYF